MNKRARAAIALALCTALAACATTAPDACRTEWRSYPRPVFIPIPERYIQPLQVPPLPADLANRDLEADIQALESVIDQAQDDRAELRRLNKRRGQGGD